MSSQLWNVHTEVSASVDPKATVVPGFDISRRVHMLGTQLMQVSNVKWQCISP